MQENQELPQGWHSTSLNYLFSISSGKMTPNSGSTEVYVGLEHIEKSKGRLLGHGTANDVTSTKSIFKAGDVLYGKLRPNLNKVVTPDFGGVCSTDILVLNPNQATNANFLKFRLLANDFVEYASGSVNGVQHPRVDSKVVLRFSTLLPPLPEQRRIVAKLEELFSRLDAGVATLRQTQAQLKRYRQSVLHAAVTGELTRAWRAAGPAQPQESGAALLQRIRQERRAQWEAAQVAKRGGQLPLNDAWKSKYEEPADPNTSELPELPEGWVWATTEQLCSSVASGSTPQAHELFADQGEVPFLKVYNLTKIGKLDFTIKPTFIRREVHNGLLCRSKANPGDVLINIVGPPLGKVSIVPEDFPEWNINQAIVAFKPVPAFLNHFLLTCLLTETIMKWLLNTSKTTTSQVNLSVTACRQLPLPVPPLAEQAEIVAEVERRLSVLDNLERTLSAELTRAERLRQSILHRAFTGQLVPQDPTDEPAAALLARLQAAPAAAPAAKAKRGRQPKATQTTLAL